MTIIFKLVLVALLAVGGLSLSGLAHADVNCAESCSNAEDGDNESGTDQGGQSASGDAVAGQVVGAVSSGDTSLDATNHSEDVDVSTGDTTASNEASSRTGQFNGPSLPADVADVNVGSGNARPNAQDGDNTSDFVQAAEATSGDGVGGQVIGVVTAAGGLSDIVAANTSEDVDVDTGDAAADNALGTLVGQAHEPTTTVTADVTAVFAENAQDGDNDLNADQSATSSTGDGVGGQVLGIVSAGDSSVDATNRSSDVDIETGDADSANDLASFVGQQSGGLDVDATDVNLTSITSGGNNAQDGDNGGEVAQDASAASGDGVGGQVAGVVTAAGGSADVVAANTSDDVDSQTGNATAGNDLAAIVGQETGDATVTADVIGTSTITNAQDGDNDLSADQSATATTGDGVGGQVLGVVSAGDVSLDATNRSSDVDVETGDADSANDFAAFVGQNFTLGELVISASDVIGVEFANAQDGDNSKELTQGAVASTGDAVGGQVAGVVTSAGGSADLVLANTSEDVDGDTGDSEFNNADEEFVGQNFGELFIGTPVEDGLQP